MLTTSDGARELSRAKYIPPNYIQFDPVPLKAGERQHLAISGIRLDAHDIPAGDSAAVEVIIAHADRRAKERLLKLVKHAVTVARVEDSMTFEVRKLDHRIEGFYALTVHAREKFPKALKTREEERSTHGTVLRVLLAHVEGFEMFVTARDIPPGDGAESDAPARALAVAADACGYPRGPAITAAAPVWPGNIAMIAVSNMHMAAWEVIAPIPNRPEEVVFGVLLKGQVPSGGLGLYAAVDLAPDYSNAAAHLPSSTLPVPRFAPGPVSLSPIWIE